MGPLGRGCTGSVPISQMGKPVQLRMRRQAQQQDTAGLQPAVHKVPELSAWPHPKHLSFPQEAPPGQRGWADGLGDLDYTGNLPLGVWPGGRCLSLLICTVRTAAPPLRGPC